MEAREKTMGSCWQHRYIRVMPPHGCDGPLPRHWKVGRVTGKSRSLKVWVLHFLVGKVSFKEKIGLRSDTTYVDLGLFACKINDGECFQSCMIVKK